MLADLGDAVDEVGDLLAEELLELRRSVASVSSTVSCRSPVAMLGTSSRRSAMMPATCSGCVRYGSPDCRRWPRCTSRREVVGPLEDVEGGGGVVGANLVEQIVEGHPPSLAKRARARSTMARASSSGVPPVGLHHQIVARQIVVIDPVEVEVAPAIRRLARLDLAQALGRRAALAPA